MIISLMKSHAEVKQMVLTKLQRSIEVENYDPLEQFFQWISMVYGLSQRQKMALLQKIIENRSFDWQSNPADELELAIREAQLTITEINENQFLSNIVKETLRNSMPNDYYLKIADMEVFEMLQKIPEIWKECGLHESTRNGDTLKTIRKHYLNT